ncbi:DUF4124 domain-containing protein [Dyella tabacisoli]|uniref:DUF4124 domain-containing protein n=1 Tax=Dyella tabacisoli TaxID=2282381 RepID=UPI001CDD8454|nr:DUF4124 domain-containing protein [Dyella tabacisoli]
MHYLPLLLLVFVTPATAQSVIHRCIGANGSPVFTDQPCSAQQATSVQPSGHSAAPASTLEPPPILCAANMAELRQSVLDAFANRDPNRLAGLMLWNGYGSSATVANIRSLTALMKQPLLGFDPDDAPLDADTATDTSSLSIDGTKAPSDEPPPPPKTNRLVLRTGTGEADGNMHKQHFTVVRQYGCLWLRNAG